MLQTRTCACARRALHEPPGRTSVRAARIHPSPALATVGWAAGAVRLAAAATLATRAHLASVCSILHNGPPARTRVRPSLLDLCHGTGRSSPAAARASELGTCFSTHRARGAACHTNQEAATFAPAAIPCALCSRTARSAYPTRPHEHANGSDSPFPHPRLPAGRWAPSALRRRRHFATRARLASARSTLHRGPPARRVCGPLYSTCATARATLAL